MTTPFDPTRPFTTRDGREVTHFAEYDNGTYRGIVENDAVYTRSWRPDGSHAFGYSNLDLVNTDGFVSDPAPGASEESDADFSPTVDDTTLPLTFTYRNHRGEVAERNVRPMSMRYGTTPPWHPEPGWLLRAFDIDKDVIREFAMKNISPTVDDAMVDRAFETYRLSDQDMSWSKMRAALLAALTPPKTGAV